MEEIPVSYSSRPRRSASGPTCSSIFGLADPALEVSSPHRAHVIEVDTQSYSRKVSYSTFAAPS